MTTKEQPRLVARTTKENEELIRIAADIEGTTLSNFITTACLERAQQVIEKRSVLRLTLEGSQRLFEALENPPKEMTPALRKAVERYKERVNQVTEKKDN